MNEQLIETLLRCIIDLLIEIEYAGDKQIDPDFCVKTMEITAFELQKLSHSDVEKIQNIISKIKKGVNDEQRMFFIDNFIGNFGLE